MQVRGGGVAQDDMRACAQRVRARALQVSRVLSCHCRDHTALPQFLAGCGDDVVAGWTI
jgi:hypothetical protein